MAKRFARVDAVLEAAAARKEFTGAVARVERHGALVYERAIGATRDDALAQPVFCDTRFDLASLTKIFTATLVLRAVARGELDLDEPLVRWFEEWRGTAHEPVTARMLLAHDSGFDSGADYRKLLGYNVERYAVEFELIAKPRERVIYSDLGFIALGALLGRIYGRSLRALARETFARPTLDYLPRLADRPSIPATEDDGWRGRVQGVVHDEKAYLMGGVAGHAGLFGSAADVAWIAERYLGALQGRGETLVPLEIVRESIREQAPDETLRRGLGWALKTKDTNSTGRLLSRATFGHTGFVGTCVWVDPERDVQGVLLTNTVYYGRRDTRDLRAAFYEAFVEDLGLA